MRKGATRACTVVPFRLKDVKMKKIKGTYYFQPKTLKAFEKQYLKLRLKGVRVTRSELIESAINIMTDDLDSYGAKSTWVELITSEKEN